MLQDAVAPHWRGPGDAQGEPGARVRSRSLSWRSASISLALAAFAWVLTSLELGSWHWADPHLLWGSSGDPVFNLYVLKWSARQIALGFPDLWNANFFYPARQTLAFSDHLLGPALQVLLLQRFGLVGTAVAAYNLLFATSFALSALVTAWVLRKSGCSWIAAAAGGAMYAFAPFRWSHLEHIQVLLVQWAPLTLWLWHRLLSEPTWRRAGCFFPIYALHLLGGCYLALMIHVPLFIRWAWDIRRRPRLDRKGWTVFVTTLLLCVALVAVLFYPYMTTGHRYGFERSATEVSLYSARFMSWVAPSAHNGYASWWRRLAGSWDDELTEDESRLFPGFVASILGVIGAVGAWRSVRARPLSRLTVLQRLVLILLALIAVGGLLVTDHRFAEDPDQGWRLALGISLLATASWLLGRRRWGGNWPVRLDGADPWRASLAISGLVCGLLSFGFIFVPLMHLVPGFSSLRAPARFAFVTQLAVVGFAASAIDRLGRQRWPRVALGCCLLVVIGLESYPVGLERRPIPDVEDFPPVYAFLAQRPDVHAIVELPRLKPAKEALWMYYSTAHWKPIANGYSGFLPPSDEELRAAVPTLPDESGLAYLRSIGITHLVVHTRRMDGRPMRQLTEAFEASFLHREIEKLFDDGHDRVYAILPPSRGARLDGSRPAGRSS
jgi:hypothetical protein